MNYYMRHLGDMARDTGHLTALEFGIYTLLLDWYYVNERPIPDAMAHRYARCDRASVEVVLGEFFTLCEEGWRQKRADLEIEDYRRKAETNRTSGRLGGRPKANANRDGYQTVSETKPNGSEIESESKANRTLASNPVTSNQEREKEDATGVASTSAQKPKSPRKGSKTTLTEWMDTLPDGDYAIPFDDPIVDWATTQDIDPDWIGYAWEAFEDRYGQGGAKQRETYIDWRATFRNAVKGDWLKIWRWQDGKPVLTTVGQQWQRASEARA